MATDAGLSVKERLALLQSGNKNPALSGPMKPTPTVAPKPKPPPVTEAKPAGFAPLKPVTAVKPLTSTATNKPDTSPNKPLGVVKPFTDTPAKPGSIDNDHEKTNGENKPQFPKLRPVGAQPGKDRVSPLVPKRPPSAPSSGQETPGGSDHTNADVMREKLDGGGSTKPMSLQEKLAALRQKADSNSIESKPKESSGAATASPPPKSPVLPGPSNTSSPGVLRPVNGPSIPIKPSDIAKSLKSAADGVLLRAKEKASEGGRNCSELFLRKADGKKFRKVEVASVTSSAPAPTKPSRIDDVDLTTFVKAYAAAKEAKLNVDAAKSDLPEEEDGEMDELYIEAESTSVTIRTKGSLRRASSVRVSKIPELTEEEEEAEDVYTDGTSALAAMEASPPDEFYDDCISAAEQQQQRPDDPDEIYEPLDETELAQESQPEAQPEAQPEPPPLPLPNNTDDKKAKKEKEKEKDKAGKKNKKEINKKEEKERKKKEEEIRKQRHKFGLNDADEKVGDGVVKSNAGASLLSKDLSVTKGEIIAILRMDHNPVGKWLVQNDQGKLGFVYANNIEVSTPTIRHVMLQFMDGKRSSIKFDDCLLIENGHNPLMTGAKTKSVADDDPEELYEPLPDEGEMDELYEAM